MLDDNIALLTIKEQAQLIKGKKLSALELTELYLRRIDRLDGKLHAFNHLLRDEALAAAREADRARRATQFTTALTNMKILAEGGTLPPAPARGRGAPANGGAAGREN